MTGKWWHACMVTRQTLNLATDQSVSHLNVITSPLKQSAER
jgi:hypothetical protein